MHKFEKLGREDKPKMALTKLLKMVYWFNIGLIIHKEISNNWDKAFNNDDDDHSKNY